MKFTMTFPHLFKDHSQLFHGIHFFLDRANDQFVWSSTVTRKNIFGSGSSNLFYLQSSKVAKSFTSDICDFSMTSDTKQSHSKKCIFQSPWLLVSHDTHKLAKIILLKSLQISVDTPLVYDFQFSMTHTNLRRSFFLNPFRPALTLTSLWLPVFRDTNKLVKIILLKSLQTCADTHLV